MTIDRYVYVRAAARSSGSVSLKHLIVVFLIVLIACLFFWSEAVAAADSVEPAANEEEIEVIVVTGSRIQRRDFNTTSPLTTVGSQDIEFSGQATIEETLNQLPQVLPIPGRSANYNGSQAGIGAAEIDLRGLGPGRSLVLLNGRRVAPSGVGNSVDLNNIPQFLIDRVEIITGGTSAVYGSDAIAGVINFVTKQDFTGFGLEAGLMMAEPGDAETYDLNLAWGHDFANDRGNVTVFAHALERDPLLAADRSFTRVTYEDDWEGNLVPTGSQATPAGFIRLPYIDLGFGPTRITFNPDGTPREFDPQEDRYNYAEVNYLQVPLSRRGISLMTNYDLTDNLEGYIEADFVRNDPEQNKAPTPAFVSALVNLDNPVLTPETRQLFTDYYACGPDVACIVLARRLTELGPRYLEQEGDYLRSLAGVRGNLSDVWQLDAWLTYSKEEVTDFWRNSVSASRLAQGLLVDPATNECYDPSGGCVPLNLFGEGNLSSEGADFIRFVDFENKTERTFKLASVFVTGSPFETWAGPLDIAIGTEWRSDETYFKPDEVLFSGDALGFSSLSPVGGSEDVIEVYAEAIVPLASDLSWADRLTLEIGGRYSDYKHAGSGWTYKAGGEWQPIDGLRLRAMYQRSVRTPNASEMFEAQRQIDHYYVWRDPVEDPCSASRDPAGSGNVEKCVMQGLPADQIGNFEATPLYPVEYLFGGNPDLEPEVGKTWTLGVVMSPGLLPDWTFAVDYFDLDVTDAIGDVDPMLICFHPDNTSNAFCDNIERDASGNIAAIDQLTSNRGLMETRGVDTQVQYAGDLGGFLSFRGYSADLSARLIWTHLLSNKFQENPATNVLDCAGYFGWPCAFRAGTYGGGLATFPVDRVTTNVHYSTGPLSVHFTWRWIEGTENAAPMGSDIFGFPEPDLALPRIDDQQYFDVGLAYAFGDNVIARLGVTNLLDNDPPLMGAAISSYNTDSGLYDVFGRSYYLTLSMQY